MSKTIEDYAKGCDLCQRIKPRTHQEYGPLQPLEAPDRKWTHISYDFITGLPKCEGKDTILVVVDRFSKGAHFIPCTEKGLTGEIAARLFLDNVWKLHGTPESTVSDRGIQFNNQFIKRLYELLDIKPSFSTAFHPQTDGQTERTNQILENYLRAYVSHKQDNWVRLLPQAEFSYNNHTSSTTGHSPFSIWYGEHPQFFPGAARSTKVPKAEELVSQLREISKETKAMIQLAQERYKEQADKNRVAEPEFAVGDKVWLNTSNITTDRPSKKLDWRWMGPYVIKKKVGRRAYELQLPPSTKIHPVFHVSLLEKVSKDNFGRKPEPVPAIIIDEHEEWEVEEILDYKLKRKKPWYLVKWKGYGEEEQSWEPLPHLTNAKELIEEYHEKYPRTMP